MNSYQHDKLNRLFDVTNQPLRLEEEKMATKEEEIAMNNLHDVCQDAIQYVGSLNHSDRENHAMAVVTEAFRAFKEKRFKDIKWTAVPRED